MLSFLPIVVATIMFNTIFAQMSTLFVEQGKILHTLTPPRLAQVVNSVVCPPSQKGKRTFARPFAASVGTWGPSLSDLRTPHPWLASIRPTLQNINHLASKSAVKARHW